MSRRPVKVRHTHSRAGADRFTYGVFRFALYGFLGVALEICFYNLVRTFREVPVLNVLFQFDWRVDPSLIFLWECASGWLIYGLTGLKVWFYADRWNFFQMTSWAILPIWCITGVLVEYIYRQSMDPDLVKAIETAHLTPEFEQR